MSWLGWFNMVRVSKTDSNFEKETKEEIKGLILFIVGILLTITILFAIVGIPLIIFGYKKLKKHEGHIGWAGLFTRNQYLLNKRLEQKDKINKNDKKDGK